MNTRSRLALSAMLVMTFLVTTALPVLATEASDEKSQLITRSQHHRIGAIVLFFFAVLAVAAFANAVQQLRGKRDQADGRFRWR